MTLPYYSSSMTSHPLICDTPQPKPLLVFYNPRDTKTLVFLRKMLLPLHDLGYSQLICESVHPGTRYAEPFMEQLTYDVTDLERRAASYNITKEQLLGASKDEIIALLPPEIPIHKRIDVAKSLANYPSILEYQLLFTQAIDGQWHVSHTSSGAHTSHSYHRFRELSLYDASSSIRAGKEPLIFFCSTAHAPLFLHSVEASNHANAIHLETDKFAETCKTGKGREAILASSHVITQTLTSNETTKDARRTFIGHTTIGLDNYCKAIPYDAVTSKLIGITEAPFETCERHGHMGHRDAILPLQEGHKFSVLAKLENAGIPFEVMHYGFSSYCIVRDLESLTLQHQIEKALHAPSHLPLKSSSKSMTPSCA